MYVLILGVVTRQDAVINCEVCLQTISSVYGYYFKNNGIGQKGLTLVLNSRMERTIRSSPEWDVTATLGF